MKERARDERGFTLVELMVTLLISSLVMGAILGVLDGQMRVERRVNAFANNQEELRDALVALQRDIRSSEPPLALPTTAEHKWRLQLNVFSDATSPGSLVEWRASGGELVREDHSVSPPVVTHRLGGLHPAADQVFFYFMTNGELLLDPLPPAPPPSPTDVARCIVRIQIVLIAAPNAGPQPAPIRSDVQIRNRTKPASGCPQAATP